MRNPFFQLFWVACCALSLMAQTRLLLGMSLTMGWMDGFVFGGTVFGYHCTHPNRIYRSIAWVAGFLGGFCFLIQLWSIPGSYWGGLVSAAPMLFWLAYYGFQRPGKAGLRAHPMAKPLTIALTWAWVTVLLPIPTDQWAKLHFILLGRAAFVFALALAYDLCDADYDLRQGLTTLTRKLGLSKSLRLIDTSLVLSGCCVCANWFVHRYEPSFAMGLLASLAFSAWWLRFVLQQKNWEVWQKPAIDALMVWQFGIVVLFRFLG
jgi:4-hydroxybenzoate polyprenyltransferase